MIKCIFSFNISLLGQNWNFDVMTQDWRKDRVTFSLGPTIGDTSNTSDATVGGGELHKQKLLPLLWSV